MVVLSHRLPNRTVRQANFKAIFTMINDRHQGVACHLGFMLPVQSNVLRTLDMIYSCMTRFALASRAIHWPKVAWSICRGLKGKR
jgi:hypothetical protein